MIAADRSTLRVQCLAEKTHVMRFRHRRNLLGLGESAGDADVDAPVVNELPFERLAGLPFVRPLLAGRQRYVGLLSQAPVSLPVVQLAWRQSIELPVVLIVGAYDVCSDIDSTMLIEKLAAEGGVIAPDEVFASARPGRLRPGRSGGREGAD
jgi:hypothetical protein